MRSQVIVSNDGQELQRADINRLGVASALADDTALASLIRLPTTNPRTKAIQCYSGEVISTGTGGVLVNAFWAFLGPATGSPADVGNTRSACFLGASQPLAAQTGGVGTFRIDLVYATLFVDQNKAGEDRYIKNPSTGIISSVPTNLPVEIYSYITIGVAVGTAALSPTAPALPSDPPGGFNIPLAYIRLPNGFGALSSTTNDMIFDVAPTVHNGMQPAKEMFAGINFGGPTGSKNKYWIGATSTGRESRFFGIDSSILSVFNNSVVDDSIDWRNRLLEIKAQTTNIATEEFPWHSSTSTSLPVTGAATTIGLANSFLISGANKTVYSVTAAGGTLSLYVNASTGALTAVISGTPALTAFFWIDATGRISNT